MGGSKQKMAVQSKETGGKKKNPYLDVEDDDGGWKVVSYGDSQGNKKKKNPYLEEAEEDEVNTGGRWKIVSSGGNKKNPYLDEVEDDQYNYKPQKKQVSTNKGKTSNEGPKAGSEFTKRVIDAHNEYRAKHGVSPLSEDPEITKIAQNYANYLAANDLFQHSGNDFKGDSLGENIYFATRMEPEDMVKAWYNEIKDYDYNQGENCFSACGHFTQVVWKASKKCGFGIAKGRSGYYGVGNYYPAGNLWGSFSKNVFPPK